jgi:hypothetical protein
VACWKGPGLATSDSKATTALLKPRIVGLFFAKLYNPLDLLSGNSLLDAFPGLPDQFDGLASPKSVNAKIFLVSSILLV